MNMRSLLPAFLLILPMLASGAQGNLPTKTSGAYFGVGVGASKIDARDSSTSVSGQSFNYRAMAGYRLVHLPEPFGLNLDLGFEAAYVDIGEIEEPTAGAEVSVDMTALVASGIIYLPIHNNWDIYGKGSLYFWDGTVTADGVETSNETNSDLAFGLGVAWETGTAFGMRLEVETLDALDGVLIGTLSATYQFK